MDFNDKWPKWLVFDNASADTVLDVERAIRENQLSGIQTADDRGHLILMGSVYLPMHNGGAVGYNPDIPGEYYIARGEAHARYPLMALGFPCDYELPFNVRRNAVKLMQLHQFEPTEAGRADLVWLCNQLAKVFQRNRQYTYGPNNFRLCLAEDTRPTVSYSQQMGENSSGAFDDYFTNPLTGRMYWMGFDYGY